MPSRSSSRSCESWSCESWSGALCIGVSIGMPRAETVARGLGRGQDVDGAAILTSGVTRQRSFYDDPVLYDRVSTPPAASVAFYVGRARETRGDVLELACGTGRVTIPIAQALARSDRTVSALDLAPAMLDAARAKSAAAHVAADFVSGDMRRFALGRRYGLIFVAFNSLLHLTTNEALGECFACVREHLAPDGIFAFDVFNPSVQ